MLYFLTILLNVQAQPKRPLANINKNMKRNQQKELKFNQNLLNLI